MLRAVERREREERGGEEYSLFLRHLSVVDVVVFSLCCLFYSLSLHQEIVPKFEVQLGRALHGPGSAALP